MSVERLKEIREAEAESDSFITKAEEEASNILMRARKESDELVKKSQEEGIKEAVLTKKKRNSACPEEEKS